MAAVAPGRAAAPPGSWVLGLGRRIAASPPGEGRRGAQSPRGDQIFGCGMKERGFVQAQLSLCKYLANSAGRLRSSPVGSSWSHTCLSQGASLTSGWPVLSLLKWLRGDDRPVGTGKVTSVAAMPLEAAGRGGGCLGSAAWSVPPRSRVQGAGTVSKRLLGGPAFRGVSPPTQWRPEPHGPARPGPADTTRTPAPGGE